MRAKEFVQVQGPV